MASGPPMGTPSVAPSGAALATASVPRLPPAPGLFSTMKGSPVICCSWSATRRAAMSGVDAGPKGTMMRVVFVGQSCAVAGAQASARTKATRMVRFVCMIMWRLRSPDAAFATSGRPGAPDFARAQSGLGLRPMSAQTEVRRITAPDIRARKGAEPIVALTSYHAHTARLLDNHCDLLLVGDSLGMVMHGLDSTVPVTLEMMILQGRAVMRGSQRALVVVDMPFGSYEASKEQAFLSAARCVKERGCGAIKVAGARRMAEAISFLTERGVPVMGHIG